MPTLSQEWQLSFSMRILSIEEDGIHEWNNILHATTGNDCCDHGDRLPAIFMPSHISKLHFGYFENDYFETNEAMPLNEWINIAIKQEKLNEISHKYYLTITINGTVLRSDEQTKPMTYENVDLFTSNNWNYAADVQLCNIEWENLAPPLTEPTGEFRKK